MKKFLIITLLLLFVVSCATVTVKGSSQTYAFPIVGDINLMNLSPRIFETQKPIGHGMVETICKYNKEIPLVRIVTDGKFRIKAMSVQYLKNGDFYAYKFSGMLCRNCGSTDHGDFLFVKDTTLAKKEIKAIVKTLSNLLKKST